MYAEYSRYLYNYGFLDGDLSNTAGDFVALAATATDRMPVFADGVVPSAFLDAMMSNKVISRTAALASKSCIQ